MSNEEKSTEVARFADVAMYEAEPIDAAAGPQVHLLWMTPDPLGAVAAACKMYKGEVVRDLSTVTDDERLHYWAEMQKTKLKAPLEFVKFHFLFEGVTRAFTHQMVRQRTAVYAQESLRFAVKSGDSQELPVGLPPSINEHDGPGDLRPCSAACRRCNWEEAVAAAERGYEKLIESGVPAEDARGLLPHAVLTRLHYSTDLRALIDHAGNRLCTQAQFEWRVVFAKIAQAIRDTHVHSGFRENYAYCDGQTKVWMSAPIADSFAPVCYQTGKCEFKANFDRACSIRERVDAYEARGVPSSEWSKGYTPRDDDDRPGVGPIFPAEWLLDPSAARKPR
jgi:flavin-dependent thymidylate synthase